MDRRLKIIDLFAGIGGIRLGFEKIGAKCVFSCEWDKYAQDVYEENFGERPVGDINDIDPKDIPDHDFLLAGFPCQPFSIAGKQLGFADTRGTLFFNIERILEEKQPYGFLLENVSRLVTHNKGKTFKVIMDKLENLGYTVHYKVLNTIDYGLPQLRKRIYIVGSKDKIHFQFPKPDNKKLTLEDILEPETDIPERYYVSESIRQKRLSKMTLNAPYPSIWHENIGGNISILPHSCALRAGGSYNYLLVNGERRLTGREMLRLQGFPDTFKINVAYNQVRKVAGNTVTVKIIELIAEQIKKAMENKQPKQEYRQLEIEALVNTARTWAGDDLKKIRYPA
ncbi:DNA cytosine methyltransferase [Candidatus Haliotispira prima]|uniref:Cytosine-specific methyltransferase n=1 Tax=Candidatus Haliotispira prima TaxID=3034016 RepID=A0ABY8MI31_9SPIO|nr:DNA cytosine methyltransferase [Candidatus Haliotispira prima]